MTWLTHSMRPPERQLFLFLVCTPAALPCTPSSSQLSQCHCPQIRSKSLTWTLCPFFSTCSLTPVLHLPQDTCLSCFLTPGLCSSCFTPLWGPSTPPPTEILPVRQMPSPPSETPGCFQPESTSPSPFCTSTVPYSFLLSMP